MPIICYTMVDRKAPGASMTFVALPHVGETVSLPDGRIGRVVSIGHYPSVNDELAGVHISMSTLEPRGREKSELSE